MCISEFVSEDIINIFEEWVHTCNLVNPRSFRLAATATLIPLQCEYYSLEGISSLINTINTLNNKNLTNNRVFGIIRTMVDMRNNLAKEVSEELEKHFPSLVFNTLIPRNVKLAEAPSHGVSVIQYMPSSFGAKAYLALAGELIRRINSGG